MGHTIILGAGVAGLSAARHLSAHGKSVELIDKGRGVGGRLATRRIGEARLDHGAQFFTTRGEAFTQTVSAAVANGAVMEWCRGFGEVDGYPRYCGTTGMTDFAKWMADDLDISLGVEAHRIECDDDNVRFLAADGTVLASGTDAVITAPIPQMDKLLDQGEMLGLFSEDLIRALDHARYFATLALLVVVDGKPNVAEPGGMQFTDGPFTFIADNHRKGISPVPALTLHAEHDYSLRRFDDDPDEVHAELLDMARPWIGNAVVVESQLKKWRYAGPVTPQPEATFIKQIGNTRVTLAGDAWAGPKVEGAFNSGLAAATALLNPAT